MRCFRSQESRIKTCCVALEVTFQWLVRTGYWFVLCVEQKTKNTQKQANSHQYRKENEEVHMAAAAQWMTRLGVRQNSEAPPPYSLAGVRLAACSGPKNPHPLPPPSLFIKAGLQESAAKRSSSLSVSPSVKLQPPGLSVCLGCTDDGTIWSWCCVWGRGRHSAACMEKKTNVIHIVVVRSEGTLIFLFAHCAIELLLKTDPRVDEDFLPLCIAPFLSHAVQKNELKILSLF